MDTCKIIIDIVCNDPDNINKASEKVQIQLKGTYT